MRSSALPSLHLTFTSALTSLKIIRLEQLEFDRAMLKPKSKFDVEPQQSKKVKRSASGEDWRVDFFKVVCDGILHNPPALVIVEWTRELGQNRKKKKGDQQEQVEKGEHDEEMQEMEVSIQLSLSLDLCLVLRLRKISYFIAVCFSAARPFLDFSASLQINLTVNPI
ncbi:hypothetical protein GUITHDRAFT_116152 [Guillardia theta CCMP2712]|uniref:Uncharacterized protein n=1 Tax=Guillardia theta (strain CCMP2712) TaxID=905079 RepID=L1IPD0_GUITC|nr:hypothetical protein GUITHDRAFT_116152 [Guillardia theta CCMP2712]EKX37675.1 hypothetical protein GUITHDRAFT_116152 [Guillardia theta CCMP2712]|eukprot:XP_005824655.1 hypothetical protein GUITHDRAFT_116152 [Guillardia theta CCMP2712]